MIRASSPPYKQLSPCEKLKATMIIIYQYKFTLEIEIICKYRMSFVVKLNSTKIYQKINWNTFSTKGKLSLNPVQSSTCVNPFLQKTFILKIIYSPFRRAEATFQRTGACNSVVFVEIKNDTFQAYSRCCRLYQRRLIKHNIVYTHL